MSNKMSHSADRNETQLLLFATKINLRMPIVILVAIALLNAACREKTIDHSDDKEEAQVQLEPPVAGEMAAKQIDQQNAHLLDSVTFGRQEQVAALLAGGADINARNLHGDTPLILAAVYGYRDIVRLLLTKEADINAQNIIGNTALIEAASKDKPEIVQELLAAGADVNQKNVNGLTAIEVARKENLPNNMLLLMSQGLKDSNQIADGMKQAEITKKVDSAALCLAAKAGNIEQIRTQLSLGADINSYDPSGKTALMLAASAGKTSVVELLVANRANLDLADRKEGQTALMMATIAGNVEVVQALLKGGANPNLKDQAGHTCLQYAQQSGNPKISQLLKQAGATAPTYNQIL